MRKPFLFIILIAGFLVSAPVPSRALELGLTPSQVYSIWENINDALLAAARVVDNDAEWLGKLAAMDHGDSEDKTPADVYDRAMRFHQRLDILVGDVEAQEIEISEAYQVSSSISPSDVFLFSGHARNTLVRWLIDNTDARQLVSPFYARNRVVGKAPGDVYMEVGLAERRLEEILKRLDGKAGAP